MCLGAQAGDVALEWLFQVLMPDHNSLGRGRDRLEACTTASSAFYMLTVKVLLTVLLARESN